MSGSVLWKVRIEWPSNATTSLPQLVERDIAHSIMDGNLLIHHTDGSASIIVPGEVMEIVGSNAP